MSALQLVPELVLDLRRSALPGLRFWVCASGIAEYPA
jgi:hypothetical protein